MPNHVTTRCTVTGPAADISAFRGRMIVTEDDEDGKPFTRLDFGKIIPMPAVARDIEENGLTPDVIAMLVGGGGVAETWKRLQHFDRNEHLGPWKGLSFFERGEIEERLERAFPGCVASARKMARCFGETGYKSWYDWSIANWGTKWNSYSFQPVADEPLQFLFETAWDFPTPVFEALARDYPTLQFKCLTFDEGWNFAGEGCFNPGAGEHAFVKGKATDDLYELVYGEKPEKEEETADSTA